MSVECYRLEELRDCFVSTVDRVLITAPTAVAALLYDKGLTIHTLIDYLDTVGLTPLKNAIRGPKISTTFAAADLLVIDEASMICPALLNALSGRLCEVLNNQQPFGSIPAVLLIADWTQLPPGTQQQKIIKSTFYFTITPFCFSFLCFIFDF